jgi:hypothetical protein
MEKIVMHEEFVDLQRRKRGEQVRYLQIFLEETEEFIDVKHLVLDRLRAVYAPSRYRTLVRLL